MKNKVLGTVMGAALLASSGAALADSPFAAENFSSTLTFTTDYVFRGASLSDGNPAIQGSFDWGQGPWFAGVWGTNWASEENANLEVDYYFGWADNVGGVDLMVMPIWYSYPGSAAEGDYETLELWTSAGMGFDNVPGAPYVTLGLDLSDNYADSGSSVHSTIAVAFTVGDFGIDAKYGYMDVDGDNGVAAYDYGYYNVGVSTSVSGFGIDLRYHDTSDEDVIGEDLARQGDTVLSVSRSF